MFRMPIPTPKSCAYCTLPEVQEREIIVGDDLVWAFPTNIPITEGHTLISPRRCVDTFSDLTRDERIAIFSLTDRITAALKKAYNAEGFNFAWNEGTLAGQGVPHFHLHIIPRKEGDTGVVDYDVRSHLYRTGDRDPSPENVLLQVRDAIRAAL